MSYFDFEINPKLYANPVDIQDSVYVCLVRPEYTGNIGSICRVVDNMGLNTPLIIINKKNILDRDSVKMSVHSKNRLSEALHFETLKEALDSFKEPILTLASTARIGSSSRPHPSLVKEAVQTGLEKLVSHEVKKLLFVFGPESDGLNNEEVALCNWVVSIPSSDKYKSLNLSHAVMVFCYEFYSQLIHTQTAEHPEKTQKNRLISHFLELAEKVSFILPNDPLKMKPRLQKILQSCLPNHIEDVKTLHGFINQVVRSLDKGYSDVKGRYKRLTLTDKSLNYDKE
jgi:tRNA/rRNA methyltransferase